MSWLPALEYNLGHPYPKNRLFLSATFAIFLPLLPILLLVNLAALGSQQVPSLQSQWQPDNILLEGCWGTGRPVPRLFRPEAPQCDPKTLSRGDVFRVSSSLFDYTVLSVWNATGKTTDAEIKMQKPTRIEYRGQQFANCYVNNTRFDYNMVDVTQTVTMSVTCPESDEYPIRIWLEAKTQFSADIFQDFVGRRYGRGLDLSNLPDKNSPDYQTAVFAALKVISTDSLSIVAPDRLLVPALSLSMSFTVRAESGRLAPLTGTITYLNGTARDWPVEANVFVASIANLVTVVDHAVNFDLMSTRSPNMFRSAAVLKDVLKPNLAPQGVGPAEWVGNENNTFYYGSLPPRYQTWAQALLSGEPVQVVNPMGQSSNSSMDTTYLCPMYKVKPMASFLAAVFVGTATMTMSAWAAWISLTALVAKKMVTPYIQCHCRECQKKEDQVSKNHVVTKGDSELPISKTGDKEEHGGHFECLKKNTIDAYPTGLSDVKCLSGAEPSPFS